jgi:putative spermidine/putrescine transport system ATP-binding protein
MRKGAIAQIGTPRDIYFMPTSRFVAEFVGAANIIEASYRDGSLVIPGGKLSAAVASDGNEKDRVVVMIRPEAIRIVPTDGAQLCGQVEAISFVGDRQRVMVDVPNSVALEPGDRVGLAIDPSAVRLLSGDNP